MVMKYTRYTIETTVEAEDIVVSMLDDLGVEGAQIEDRVALTDEELAGMFVDIMPPVGEDDGRAFISFYLESGENHEDLISSIKAELSEMRSYTDVGSCNITSSETDDEDFLNNWKKYFHQFYIDDILFIPSWEQVENTDHSGQSGEIRARHGSRDPYIRGKLLTGDFRGKLRKAMPKFFVIFVWKSQRIPCVWNKFRNKNS